MRKLNIVFTIVVVILQCYRLSSFAESSTESQTLVATVLTKQIFLKELEQCYGAEEMSIKENKELVSQLRVECLRNMIMGTLAEKFCQDNPCKPTEEEINAVYEAMNDETRDKEDLRGFQADKDALLQEMKSPSLSEERRKEITKKLEALDLIINRFHGEINAKAKGSFKRLTDDKIALIQEMQLPNLSEERKKELQDIVQSDPDFFEYFFVKQWKFYKALYEKYGGTVIWEQTGLTPLEALKSWLEEHERNKDFQILDSQLRAEFWQYFLDPHKDFIIGEDYLKEYGLKHPFERPVWLKDKN